MLRRGGRYVVENGERRRIEGTESHQRGDRARDEAGRPIGAAPRLREEAAIVEKGAQPPAPATREE